MIIYRETSSSVQITSFMFEVCDSLLNIGPCGNVSMGEPAFLSEEFSNNRDPDLELVTTSGHGKNGAICVLQRTIRPQVCHPRDFEINLLMEHKYNFFLYLGSYNI